MEANEDVLVSEEASNILASTGLVEIYRKAAAHDTNQVVFLFEKSASEPSMAFEILFESFAKYIFVKKAFDAAKFLN